MALRTSKCESIVDVKNSTNRIKKSNVFRRIERVSGRDLVTEKVDESPVQGI